MPPQMDEIVEKIKKFKFPGGPFIILLVLMKAYLISVN